jgi:cell division initiation protein
MENEIELDRTKLKKGFRGYDPKDVDRMLQEAADTVQELIADKEKLEDEVARQQTEIERLKRDDRLVQDALISAQRTADEIRASARKEADTILEDARQMAGNEALVIRNEAEQIAQDIERLKAERKRYIDDMRLILEKHYKELASIAQPG